jgi:hypothetical protein
MSGQGETLAEKAASCDRYCPPGFFESRFGELLPVINELQDALSTLVELIEECQDFESLYNPEPPILDPQNEWVEDGCQSGPPFDHIPF